MATAPLPHSLSRRSFLYVIAICLALLAYEGGREWLGHEAALERAETETRNLARSLRQQAEDTYEIARQAVTLVAYQVSLDGLDEVRIDTVRAMMRRTGETSGRLRGIHVVGADGALITSTAQDLPASEDRSGHGYFAYHRDNSSAAVYAGPPVRAADGVMEITVSRRLEDASGNFAGVVVAAIDSRYFSEVYRSIETGRQSIISLLDANGTLLASQPYRPELIGRKLPGLLPPDTASGAGGSYRYVWSVDGVERISGWDRGTEFPLVASVALSSEEALASWVSGALFRGLATLALVVTVALLGLRLTDQIHRRQKSEQVLARKEAEFRLLAESASDLVERFDADGVRTYISPAIERMTGYTPAELMGQSAFDVLSQEDRPEAEAAADRLRRGETEQETITFRRTRKDGIEIWLETSLRVAAEASGKFSVVGVTRDITERKNLELQLESMALRDGLTGLANRRAFDDALAREVMRARRAGTALSLLMIDADRFKRFNDDNGHLAGDACLKSIAAVVAMAARRPADLAARYGGEELALLLPETDLMSAHAIANDIVRQVEALAIPHQRNLPWKAVTVSIGAAVIDPRDHDTLHDGAWLISTADLALYDAKAHGRNQAIATPQGARPRLAG